MKLRIRCGGQRYVLEVFPRESISPHVTLRDVREKIQNEIVLDSSTFEVSLNGKDALEGDETAMNEFGVVSGDLLYVLTDVQEHNVNSVQSVRVAHAVPEICDTFSESETESHTKCADEGHKKDVLPHQLMGMGCKRREAANALSASGSSDIEKAVEILHRGNQAKEKSDHAELAGLNETSQHQSIKSSGEGCSNSGESLHLSFHYNRPQLVLCREGIPDVLKCLYSVAEVSTMHEALCLVVHVLMMETGFRVYVQRNNQAKQIGNEEDQSAQLSEDSYDSLPDNWRSPGLVQFRYEHPTCQGLSCKVACTSLGPYTLAHGTIECDTDVDIYQCKVTATDYVRVNVPLTAGPSSVYYNLHRLSRIVKDSLALPLLSSMRSLLGLPGLVGFMALPAEVKLVLLSNLDVKSITRLSRTCKELKVITEDSSLWQHLCFRDFGISNKESSSWKSEYMHYYKMKKDRERVQYVIPGQPYFPSFGTGIIPNTFYPPGMIGGNSDLYPNVPFMPGGFQPHIGPGIRPGRMPRPRFDPFGPLPDQDVIPGPGRGRGGFSFPRNFGPRYF